jgi:hypothetical protein
MPFGLGFFATAGAGGAAGSFDLLETQILGSSTSSVTFSSLSTYASTYQHLQVRAVVRTDRNSGFGRGWFRFNGDSATNYSWHSLYGDGTSVGATNQLSEPGVLMNWHLGSQTTANIFAPMVIDILDSYETTKFKTIRILGGRNGSSDRTVYLDSGSWRNTNAVSSITLAADGNWVQFSRFSLYGIRG